MSSCPGPSGRRARSSETSAYRDRPSHEQQAYARRIEREHFFVERELAALALRRLSPLKSRGMPQPSDLERTDPKAHFAYLRRVRGLD